MDPATLDRLRTLRRDLAGISRLYATHISKESEGARAALRQVLAQIDSRFPELHPKDKDTPDAK